MKTGLQLSLRIFFLETVKIKNNLVNGKVIVTKTIVTKNKDVILHNKTIVVIFP